MNNIIFQKFQIEIPIGQLFIKYKQDIYKEINEIYYGYSNYLNNHFHTDEPIWGRKCTIYYQEYCIAVLYEFFSPKLINFL